jgi:tRNA G37 N-methylase TrmD
VLADLAARDRPEILLSGNHARVKEWRHEQARRRAE